MRDPLNKVVGGITGEVFGGWVYISLLWVDEALRNQGYGSRLLSTLEQEAIKLNCGNAHLDTYCFEARPFYEKAGYKVFGVLKDYPKGYSKFFMWKILK